MNSPVAKFKYYYPIVLKNEDLHLFRITPEIDIRQITASEKEEFFGLVDVDYWFTNNPRLGYVLPNRAIPSQTKKGRYPFDLGFHRGLFDGSSDIFASNYVLIIECSDRPDALVQRLNLSFKLFRPTSTGGYLGFKENETDTHFHFFGMPIHGPFDYLSLNDTDLTVIQRIFNLVEDKKDDDKFKLLAGLYERTLQGGNVDFDVRFLLLTICLESLYLLGQTSEAQFRLSVRGAKLLSQHGLGEARNIFNKVKEIYQIRSQLVHTGKTKQLTFAIFYELTNIVRASLIHYIENPKFFSKDALADIEL